MAKTREGTHPDESSRESAERSGARPGGPGAGPAHWPADAFLDLADAVGRERSVHGQLAALCRHARGFLTSNGRTADVGTLLPDPEDPDTLVSEHAGAAAGRLLGFELTRRAGPCRGVLTTGTGLPDVPLDERERAPWPRLASLARELRVRRMTVLPLRHDAAPYGVLAVYRGQAAPLDAYEVARLQALADATALGLGTRQRFAAVSEEAGHLQRALTERVPVEQAKGILAERLGCPPGEAFHLLRTYARSHQTRLHEVSRQIIEGELTGPPFEARRR